MMNDKIYTLALQAGLIEFDSIPGSSAVTPTYDSIIKSKKFAELIVRECAEMMPQENLKQMVLKRFGVEE